MEMRATCKILFVFVIFLGVTCQYVASQTGNSPAVWVKANTSPVCFKTKGKVPGVFHAPTSGKLAAVSLVHLYGYVSCNVIEGVSHWSFWGCTNHNGVGNNVDVTITTSSNDILLPPSEFNMPNEFGAGKWSVIPGYDSNTPSLIMSSFTSDTEVSSPRMQDVREGDELRLWYAEDLLDWAHTDNGGEVCCDVYTLII